MKILVRHIDPTTVEVTLVPGWIRRLFGARMRRGTAVQKLEREDAAGDLYIEDSVEDCGYDTYRWVWVWQTTLESVSEKILRAIECSPIEELPSAHIVRRLSS